MVNDAQELSRFLRQLAHTLELKGQNYFGTETITITARCTKGVVGEIVFFPPAPPEVTVVTEEPKRLENDSEDHD
jgi:hypothetical protein